MPRTKEIKITKDLAILTGAHGKTKKRVRLVDFIADLCSYSVTPLLPSGTRFYTTSGRETTLVIEQPPQVHAIKWGWGKKTTWEHSDYFRTYCLAFPYVIFVIQFVRETIDSVRIFYRTAPLSSLDNKLFQPNLPNIYSEAGDEEDLTICLGNDLEVNLDLSMAQKVEQVVAFFWASVFSTLDWLALRIDAGRDGNDVNRGDARTNLFYQSRRLDRRVSSLKAWQEATKKNPLFVLEVNWRQSRHTLKDFLETSEQLTFDNLLDCVYRTKRC